MWIARNLETLSIMSKTTLTSDQQTILFASCLLSAVLGSVHAFSVFLQPMEAQFAVPRSLASLTYSFALVSLTLAVMFGHHIFSRVRPARLSLAICLIAASGAVFASIASSLQMVWIGYGLIFGAANGLGYAFGLQLSAQACPGREGLAMGFVTAAYASGAAISPALFSIALEASGMSAAMIGLACVLIAIAPVCAILLSASGIRFQGAGSGGGREKRRVAGHGALILLWLGYGAGVAAGLMAIGHATGIAASSGVTSGFWIAPVIIAVFNLIGSLSGGMFVDRAGPVLPLGSLPLLSAAALLALAFAGTGALALSCLGVVGLAYGATIAAYPASIAKLFGVVKGTRVYGRVFTAWGTAGLLAPWFAGYLFDHSGGYRTALLIAAALAIGSTIAATVLFRIEKPN